MHRSWLREHRCDDYAASQRQRPSVAELLEAVHRLRFFCGHCGFKFIGYRRIDFLHWLLHSGICSECGKRNGSVTLAPQLITILLTVAVLLRHGLSIATLFLLFQVWFWVAIGFLSRSYQIIPDVLTYSLVWI